MSLDSTHSSHSQQAIIDWLGTGSVNLFGSPLAGKDTQSRRLAQWLDAPVISGGQILRNSPIPDTVQTAIDAGYLAPTREYLRIVTPYLSREEFQGRPLILNALGRWHGEEETILQAASQSGHPLRAVIFLHMSADSIKERWHAAERSGDRGHRTDDEETALKRRLEEFESKTKPVLDFYDQQGLLLEVDGHMSPDDVEAAIVERLYRQATM